MADKNEILQNVAATSDTTPLNAEEKNKVAKIREELGYVPQVSFLEGLGKTIEWYKNNL